MSFTQRRERNAKSSNPLHEITNANFKSIGDGLNCEKRRILNAALNTAQKRPVNVGFGGESFLRQLSLQPHIPNPLSELFRNVMAHLLNCYTGTLAVAVGYTQHQA